MRERPRTTLWLCLAVWLAACAGAAAPRATPTPFVGAPRAVVIDTDMAGDDWMAILYLLQRQDVSVKAITVTGAGEAHCEPGVRNALGLIALSGEMGIPVACGRETPLEGNRTFPAAWREGVDNLFGLSLPEGANPTTTSSAVELLIASLQSSPEKISLLTLGPLTNLAEALRAAPSLTSNVEMIYVMGGAVDVAGNVGASGAGIENDAAEWNMYIDPHAASIALQSGAPITLVSLDATNHVPVTTDFYRQLQRDHATPVAAFVYDVLTRQKDFIETGGYYFWDPLAAAILTDVSLAVIETRRLTIVQVEGPESGRTQISENGAAVRVAVSADGARFEQIFLDALNAP